jgi:hypothetical protein
MTRDYDPTDPSHYLRLWLDLRSECNADYGHGRAAWLITRWATLADCPMVRVSTRYSRSWSCARSDCETSGRTTDHGPFEVLVPSDQTRGSHLVRPLCAPCAAREVDATLR